MAGAAMFSIQLGLALSVHLFDQLGPLGTAWLRLVWAALLLLVLIRPRPTDFTTGDVLGCVALGAATGGMMLFFMLAVAHIPLGTASALEFLGPLTVAVYTGAGRRRLWALPAAVGVALLTEPWHGDVDAAGIGFALAAAVCWAAYILLTQRVGDRVTGLSGLAVSMPVAAVVATLAAGPTGAPGDVTWLLVLAGLGLAVLNPVLPLSLEFVALRRLTTTAFGTLMCLEPAIALAIGLVTLGQVPGPTAATGVLCVVVAGIGATRTGTRTTPPVEDRARAPGHAETTPPA